MDGLGTKFLLITSVKEKLPFFVSLKNISYEILPSLLTLKSLLSTLYIPALEGCQCDALGH